MKTMRFFSAIVAGALILASCGGGGHKAEPEVLVQSIKMEPNSMDLIVGQTQPLKITPQPANASNVDQLTIVSNNENVATFDGGSVTAVKSGNAKVIATCGAVRAECKIGVYWGMTKNNVKFPIKTASGYNLFMATSSVQEIEIDFTDGTEHIGINVPVAFFGRTIDVSQQQPDIPEDLHCSFSVWKNQNENFYAVYLSRYGEPYIIDNMWTPQTFSISGSMRVDKLTGNDAYKVDINILFGNGNSYKLYYEGTVAMKNE